MAAVVDGEGVVRHVVGGFEEVCFNFCCSVMGDEGVVEVGVVGIDFGGVCLDVFFVADAGEEVDDGLRVGGGGCFRVEGGFIGGDDGGGVGARCAAGDEDDGGEDDEEDEWHGDEEFLEEHEGF